MTCLSTRAVRYVVKLTIVKYAVKSVNIKNQDLQKKVF